MAYTTALECKDQSTLAALLLLTDPELDKRLQRASDLADFVTKQRFDAQVSVEKIFDGSGSRLLVLSERLVSLEAVTILDRDANGLIIQERPLNGAISRNWTLRSVADLFPVSLANIKVKGSWGYAEPPSKVKTAICSIAEQLIRLETSGSSTNTSSATRTTSGTWSARSKFWSRRKPSSCSTNSCGPCS